MPTGYTAAIKDGIHAVHPNHRPDLRYVLQVLEKWHNARATDDEIAAAMTGMRYIIKRTEESARPVSPAPTTTRLDALQQADAFLALLRGLFLSNAPQLATESDRRRLFEECVRIRTVIAATSGVQEVPHAD